MLFFPLSLSLSLSLSAPLPVTETCERHFFKVASLCYEQIDVVEVALKTVHLNGLSIQNYIISNQ
jgi:hypothetical protein